MTIKEALNQLEGIKEHAKIEIDPDDENDFFARDVEALDMAIAALSFFDE